VSIYEQKLAATRASIRLDKYGRELDQFSNHPTR
jgi:hypothetical protein